MMPLAWNFDFDYCAILIISLLMIYTLRRKDVPLLRNRVFLWMMAASMLVAVMDVVASILTELTVAVPIPVLYGVNMLYYLCLAFSPWVFLLYCFAVTRNLSGPGRRGIIFSGSLFFVCVILILLSPKYHFIFRISEEHLFSRGPFRQFLYVEYLLYLVSGFLHIFIFRKKIRKIACHAITGYVISALLGHTLQVYVIPYTQTISLSVMFGILIIYLSFQNPDFYRDEDTGLFSDDGFEAFVREIIAYRTHSSWHVMNITNYHEMETMYGAVCLREVITQIAEFVHTEFPNESFFYMEDGNIVMVPDRHTDYDRIQMVSEQRFLLPFHTSRGDIYVSPVYANAPEYVQLNTVEELHRLIRRTAKESLHKERFTVYDISQELWNEVLREQDVEDALSRAITENTLEVFYQPIFSTKEHRLTSVEALVRIRDEKLGLLFPDEFIGRAEQNGMILALGERVFEKVCDFISTHNLGAMGLNYIDVNLSPFQCIQEQLADRFLRIMKQKNVSPDEINLEITESATTDMEMIRNNLNRLASAGVSFALDDYGTGYSNLVSVLSLPLKIIKIDKSIVWAYFRDGNSLLLQVIKTFQYRDLQLVCEGVEDEEMALRLEELGVDYEQGYFFSKPVPEAELLKILEQYR